MIGRRRNCQAATAPAGSVEPRRTGARNTGSYWGSAGERIDVFSGNLNFTLPLLRAQARGGWGATFALSYDSQMWRQDGAGVWRLGRETGYGYGWRLQAGSLTPVWRDAWAIHHYRYTDATGAEYRLDVPHADGTWTSRDGIYITYDSYSGRLFFPDGGFWVMGCVAAGEEDDAGSHYPNLMHDTNGNMIAIRYLTGTGAPVEDSSGRIGSIHDVRGGMPMAGWPTATYIFSYDTGATPPRLMSIANVFVYRVGSPHKRFLASRTSGYT